VSSGAEAVQKALSEKFDIIIMDLGLPGMTGIDTTRELKRHSTTAHVPIVGYSGLSLSQRALQAGMAAFLLKPVSLQVIQEVIEKYILP
jgi:CheY-like chemotaxis protein